MVARIGRGRLRGQRRREQFPLEHVVLEDLDVDVLEEGQPALPFDELGQPRHIVGEPIRHRREVGCAAWSSHPLCPDHTDDARAENEPGQARDRGHQDESEGAVPAPGRIMTYQHWIVT